MDTPINKLHVTYETFLRKEASTVSSAQDVVKAAKDQEALTSIKDPAEKGTASIPSFGDGANREAQNLPENQSNLNTPDNQHNIMNVTQPNGTGEGSYVTPENGNAKDQAATSPTTPFDKISSDLQESINASKEAAQTALYGQEKDATKIPAGTINETAAPEVPKGTVQPDTGKEPEKALEEAAKNPAPVPATEKPASATGEPASATGEEGKTTEKPAAAQEVATVTLPVSIANDQDLTSKLASIGAVMVGTEEGQAACMSVLAKEAGIKECRNFIAEVQAETAEIAKQASEMQKQAAAAQEAQPSGYTYNDFRLMEMDKQAHTTWLNEVVRTDFEKKAYATGAQDGAAAADAMAAGAEPAIPGSGDLTTDDLIAYLEQLIAANVLSKEEAEAVLQELGGAMQDGNVDQGEMDAGLQQALASGAITQEQAQQIMQGNIPVPQGDEENAAAAAAQDPAVAGAAKQAVTKAASVVQSIWAPQQEQQQQAPAQEGGQGAK